MVSRYAVYQTDQAQAEFENAPFNGYSGPENPELLIITSGTGWLYSVEAVEALKLEDKVGILKLGTTWPLPEKLVLKYLEKTSRVLVVEEVDPVLEQNVASIIGHNPGLNVSLFGRYKKSALPQSFELNPDVVINALATLMNTEYQPRQTGEVPAEAVVNIPPRDLTFCAGCPHRASFFLLKQTLRIHEGNGVIMEISAVIPWAVSELDTFCCTPWLVMVQGQYGRRVRPASRFGFDQPVVALAGFTFFHSCRLAW